MKFKNLYAILGVFLFLLFGCNNDNSADQGTGKLTIRLTDEPFPHDLIAEANVTIFKVEARKKVDDSGDMDMNEENESEDGSSFVVLMEEEIDVNLLTLTNGVTETLVDADIPAGTYDLFRVYVKGVNVVLNDEGGTTYDLTVPSGEQTGIKVFVKPALVVAGGLSADLLFDFDVSRSFVPRGNLRNDANFNGFNFKPVIKVSNLTTSGTLYGEVTTAVDAENTVGLENVAVTIFQNGETITTTVTDAAGGYMVMGLMPGTYDVTATLEGYDTASAEGVTITTGNKTLQNFELVVSQ
jgi:hypothetical protein